MLCDCSWSSFWRYLSVMRYADVVCLSKPYFCGQPLETHSRRRGRGRRKPLRSRWPGG
ncbi:MAG: hypothetical protein QW417_06050 [Zestosphaera sp.]